MSGANYTREAKPDANGRWPANLIHDGSDEVVGLFPDQTSGANPTSRGGIGYMSSAKATYKAFYSGMAALKCLSHGIMREPDLTELLDA